MIVAQGLIRKISVGDLKNGITYVVGQPMLGGRAIITEIRLDVDGSQSRGYSKYDVLVMKNDSDVSRLWKSIENMPVVAEYELDLEQDVETEE